MVDLKKEKIDIPLSKIIEKTSKRECLFCEKKLDREFGEGIWHIPLCRFHRKERLDYLYKVKKKMNKRKKNGK